MTPYTLETGIIVPLNRSNVDTDAMLPKQFLKSIKRTGFGVNLFEEWRYLDDWYLGIDYSKRPLNPDFVLNFPQYQGAKVLIAQDNFGCGSSREHAVWALNDYGIRTVIAPSFGDIFFNNCFKNGVLPIVLSEEEVNTIFALIEENGLDKPALEMSIDLAQQTVSIADKTFNFDIDQFRKNCLLQGLDEIGITLQNAEQIKAFEETHKQNRPWVFQKI
ncbi:MAG: 3-isopropylmalate dehydratase small subunit [Moraxellaceae bacterium]|nr:3-isopropylmalate dehydratase small subunit [Moraxellaceae bacterium]